jgi:hypothetical protein
VVCRFLSFMSWTDCQNCRIIDPENCVNARPLFRNCCAGFTCRKKGKNMNSLKTILLKKIGFIALVCATLGLAPFHPEPHIWGKIKWIMGGAIGMKPMDWFDTLLHGAPFLLLVLALIFKALTLFDNKNLNPW